jgi:alpha-mannosidase
MLMIKERVKKLVSELQQYIYSDSLNIEHYKMAEASMNGEENLDLVPWIDFNTSQRWGGYDKDFWFKTDIQIPAAFHGKTVVYDLRTGREHAWDSINPQFKFYINGKLVQGLDINHRDVIITECAKANEVFSITLHAHSGMDDMLSDLKSRICVLEPTIENLYYNLKIPMEALELLKEDDKNAIDMLKILNDTVSILDLRRPFSEMFFSSVEKANSFIEEKIYDRSLWHEDVSAHCIGHTHIDVAWRWTIAQTRHKVVRSFSTALNLMKNYPEYIFFSSQPQLYQFVKEDEPNLYEEIKEKIKEGTWEPEGAMWVEADCNLISGESLVRQILYGTRFFKKEFDIENRILWLPDVFGYSAAMPQIMKKAGVDYFITSKLSWNEYNKVPCDTFMWRGIDGTEVLTHFIMNREYQSVTDGFYTAYGGMLTPSQVAGGWQRYQQKDLNTEVLHPYGYGDGGGGPTKEMLETARRLSKGIPGVPKVKMGKAIDFLEKLEKDVKDTPKTPKWVGELYLEYHRGTYTSMAKNKKYNRKCEFLYGDIEWLSSMNKLVDLSFQYPEKKLNKGWETILLNQFHDILPGCSIPEVYVTSHKQYEEVVAEGNSMLQVAIENLASKIQLEETSIILFNPLGFKRSDVVAFDLPENFENIEVYSLDGKQLMTQVSKDKKVLFLAEEIPAKGYKTFILKNVVKPKEIKSSMEVTPSNLSNKFFNITLDKQGNITSIYDKLQDCEVLKKDSRGNVLQAFEDKPVIFDAWDINMYYEEKMWEVDEIKSIEVLEKGPIRSGLRIVKAFMDSTIEQNIYIYEHTSRIDFQTTVDWKEKQILLKAAFPVAINANKATYEIQYGNVERPTHANTSWEAAKFEVCGHKWADVSEDNYGVSLLNDCKYGHDIKDSVMRLTLIKSGIYPNPKADQEVHNFTYSLYPHAGDFKEAKTIEESYSLNCPLYSKIENPHTGFLPTVFSMIQVDKENVVVEVIKKSEDSNDVIIRMFESYNRRSKVTVTLGKDIKSVTECNLLEKDIKPIEVQGNEFNFVIKPFEISTFKISF